MHAILQFLRHYLWYITFGLLVIVGVAYAIIRYQGNALAITQPIVGPAVQAVYTTGNVEATQTIELAPKTGGWLSGMLVDEGAEVAANQLLATLDAADLAANVAQLRAKEAYAVQNLKRLEDLQNTPANNPDALASARSNANAARAARVQAEAQLGFTKLVAPVTGTIVQRDGEVGTLIKAGQPVFYLAAGPLRVTAQVDEEEINQIKVGLPVLIRAEALPGEIISGTVLSITPRGDAVGRTFRVRIGLPPNTALKIGMTTELNIILSQTNEALLVPNSAVVNGKAWVVKSGRTFATPVQVGAVGVSLTQILSGLTLNASIVINPVEDLKNGQRVRVK